MRFKGPYYLFNSAGGWIGFCVGPNLFNTDGVWCGWFPWEGSYDAVKPDGSYLGTVLGSRFYFFEKNQHLRVHKYYVYPGIPTLPSGPKPAAPRELFEGTSNVDLKSASAIPKSAIPSPIRSAAHAVAPELRAIRA